MDNKTFTNLYVGKTVRLNERYYKESGYTKIHYNWVRAVVLSHRTDYYVTVEDSVGNKSYWDYYYLELTGDELIKNILPTIRKFMNKTGV